MKLHTASRDGASLADALAVCDGIGFLATPWEHHVVRVRGGRAFGVDGPVDLAAVYEGRVFNSVVEVRWLDPGDGGRASVLTDDVASLPAGWDSADVETIDRVPGSYLVWGRAAGVRDGWTALTAARIGTLHVPVEIPEGGRALIRTCEYVGRETKHGNAHVIDERLIAIEAAEGDT
ncbi:type III-D CRISPR-associated protein Csx19 [Actinomadura atramentaria]|uniref:type III-D CRISPR-associated protein Csx19 n=1 Tax=Actinomadura atramentaria TaxID=1990 RepID=UPI000374154E|nr:CRISPR-associated protein Csx19 [Actinomadura atramentaria]